MKNPWTKKNPFMSMWLSGAHKIGGAAIGQASAAIRRETKTAATKVRADTNKQIFDFWNSALGVPAKPKRRKRR
jgi:hypothetical protein